MVVNAPFWLAGAWSGLKGILPDTVQVDLLSESKYPNALKEYIDEDQIPPEYGGTSPYKLGEHPYEMALQELAQDENRLKVSSIEPNMPPTIITTSAVPASPSVHDKGADTSTPVKTPLRSRPLRRRVGSVGRVRSASNPVISTERTTGD